MSQIIESQGSEQVKVESWRLHVLIEAGYPVELATRIAHTTADLHRAVELIRSGCDAELAERILT